MKITVLSLFPEYFEPLIKPMEKITFPVEYREDL